MDRSVALVPHTTARRIQEMIRAGELLLAQRELAERLNVSRSLLREALSVLEPLDVVRTEPRRGTRIAAVDAPDAPALQSWRFAARYSHC